MGRERRVSKQEFSCSLEIQQLSKEVVHLGVAESPLDLHVLHDLQADGLEGGQTQQ